MKYRRAWIAAVAAILTLLFAPAVFAQGETTASVTGAVLDSSGAAIPNAKVTITNVDTGTTMTQQTDAGGNYNFPSLPIGNYRLTAEAGGFRTYVRENIVLHVNDRARIDPSMQVGGATETVTVTESVTLVETEKPTLSGLVSETQVRELPLPNRNFMGLTLLVPGVTFTGGREISLGGLSGNPMFINGSRSTSNNWMVDGSRNTDTGSNGTLFNYPSVDAIGEFRILTNSYDAQFGRNAGGIINVVVKSGTNRYHGSAYEFVRNDLFNARDAFQFTRPIPDRDSYKTPYRYNNYGYSLGGPFYIPKLYPKEKSKTFFFWSEEWRKLRNMSVLSSAAIVPTADQRNGIFSTPITDPRTGKPFPNNTIPAERLDANAKALIAAGFWPMPNISANQFRWIGSQPSDYRQELARVDHNVNDNWRLMVRYIHDQFAETRQTGMWGSAGLPNTFPNPYETPATNIVARSTNILNPRMLNEFQFDYATNAISAALPDSATGLLSKVPGFKVNPFFPNGDAHNAIGAIPGISISGIQSSGPDDLSFFNENPSWTFQDNFTWTKGAHEFKMGALYTWEKKNENAGGPNTNGYFSFSPDASTKTGNAFANFLLGLPTSYTEDQTDVRVHVAYKGFESYAQDTWKVTPRFTLTMGVRWSYFGVPYDEQNILMSFLPGKYSAANRVTVLPNGSLATDANGQVIGDRFNGLIFPAGVYSMHDSPWGRKVQNDSWTNLGPRLGISYDPTGKGLWAIRAGYGIYYDRSLVGIIEQNGFADPLANQRITIDNPQFQNPQAGLPRNAVLPIGLTTVGTPFKTPQTQQWNFNVQRQIAKNSFAQVAYAGSAGNYLLRDIQLNQPLLNAAASVGGAFNRVRPYPGYAGITNRETRSKSRYNAFQAMYRHTATRWLTGNVAYTYGKTMTDSSADRGESPQNSYNLAAEWAPSTFDRTQVLTPSLVFTVPFNQGWNPVLKQLVGGWEVTSIMNFWSGTPLTITQSGDPYYAGGGTVRPDVIGRPVVSNSIQTRLCYIYSSGNSNCAGIYGQNAFIAVDAVGNPYGKTPHYGTAGRSILRAPGIINFDIGASKNFSIRESMRFQFRAEAFNAFNHIELGGPGTNISTSSFGQITSNRGPRIIQLGLKYLF